MITSKIKNIESVKPYEGKNGTTYYHNLEMENGDKINIGKLKEQEVGFELTYEFTQTVGEREFTKAKSVTPMFKKSSNGSQREDIAKSVAFKGAIDLVVSDRIDIQDVERYTNQFFDILTK